MERASRFMGKLNLPGDSFSAEHLVCAAWTATVGARIAKHARAERLVRTKLIVGVDDSVWQRQLFGMSRMILDKLAANLGTSVVVDDLEFRVAVQKRGPRRAERSTTAAPSADEADGIEDADLRRLYRTSRKKELA